MTTTEDPLPMVTPSVPDPRVRRPVIRRDDTLDQIRLDQRRYFRVRACRPDEHRRMRPGRLGQILDGDADPAVPVHKQDIAGFPLGLDWSGHVDVRRSYEWDPDTHVDGVDHEHQGLVGCDPVAAGSVAQRRRDHKDRLIADPQPRNTLVPAFYDAALPERKLDRFTAVAMKPTLPLPPA